MNNDRELLELAAKAAGIDVHPLDEWTFVDRDGREWNPLINDGDALRLVVKLMEFEPYKSRGKAPFISNDLAATRRAIVVAAAAIGETIA